MEFSKFHHGICLLVLIIAGNRQAYSQCAGTHLTLAATSGSYAMGEMTYPVSGSYGESLDCAWLIESSMPASHSLLFHVSISTIATGDFLRIYDGTSTSGTTLFTATASTGQTVSEVATSGNAYIRFTSDGTVGTAGQQGFRIRYMSASTNDYGCTAASLTATDSVKYLTSQNFPAKYPTSTSCSWTISAQGDCGTLVLDTIYLSVEGCDSDFLTLTYDDNPTEKLCVQNDWYSTKDYATSNTSAIVTMTSDSSDEWNGFVMAYSRNGAGCTSVSASSVATESGSLLPLVSLITVPIIAMAVAAGLRKAGAIKASKVRSI
ncbi:cubilin-like [Mizuhopecten yessoensis]|uniref:Embryonic protein UVS.2 n=1 Tax=Mizuhopecten yessoensis TaxID=6573 RepID=A0A210Q7M2_MIZYE|nr:cubilin-like [Mizuhopecten yessoensis]OWF44742.1 Embryonic protein UVS.2 [Mizuhopecten yessoensis]